MLCGHSCSFGIDLSVLICLYKKLMYMIAKVFSYIYSASNYFFLLYQNKKIVLGGFAKKRKPEGSLFPFRSVLYFCYGLPSPSRRLFFRSFSIRISAVNVIAAVIAITVETFRGFEIGRRVSDQLQIVQYVLRYLDMR